MTLLIFFFWFWVSTIITAKIWGMDLSSNGEVDGAAAALTFFQAVVLMWLFYAIRDRETSRQPEQDSTLDGET